MKAIRNVEMPAVSNHAEAVEGDPSLPREALRNAGAGWPGPTPRDAAAQIAHGAVALWPGGRVVEKNTG